MTACYAHHGWAAKASHRVNRGGSWNNTPRNCRPANRNRNEPTNRNNNLGFRVAAAQPAWWIPSRTGPDVHPSRFRTDRAGKRRLQAPCASSERERSGRLSEEPTS
ncbi:MAG: SUMF1/EgtB/PvdO family nonheme iron enzyme [Isosphaeraceae bacterium]